MAKVGTVKNMTNQELNKVLKKLTAAQKKKLKFTVTLKR